MGQCRAEIGLTVGGYLLEQKLGAGGMAEVYLARRTGPRGFTKRVAIKRILPSLSRDTELVQMFCDEARVAATLSHPNIAQVIEFGEHEGEFFIVMEYVDGVSCSALLRGAANRGEALPVAGALYVARDVLLALACAHEAVDESGRPLGIVHRDVSPSNVLVSRSGTVKLIDFGITRSVIAERQTLPGELKGKLRYMSPEQILGAEMDCRSDLFAVGIVLAEMVAGRALFSGRSDLEILTRISRGELGLIRDGGVPPDVAVVLERALAHRPGNRFQSAREFARAIDAVADARALRLDDTAIVPYLHALGVLPSSSGTRPAATAAPSHRVAAPPARPLLAAAPPAVSLPARPSSAPTTRAASAASKGQRSGTYRVRTRSGKVVGPLPRADMLALLATGRLSARSSVSGEADGFVHAGDVPALSALAGHPAYRFREDDDVSPAWLHRIEPASVPTTLYRLAAERRTGLLAVVDGRRRKRVFFEAGDPSFIASTDREELLGRRLVRARIIHEKSLDAALSLEPPLRVGEALVAAGAMGAARLVRELARQLEDRLIDLGSWEAGELRWFPDVRLAQTHHVKTREPTLTVLTRLVREQYAPGDIATLLRPITKEVLTPGPVRGLTAAALGLASAELSAFALVDGSVTVRDVVTQAMSAGVGMADALRAVFIGLCARVFAAASWPPGPGPSVMKQP
jgi:serine/threonine-protein kinase